MITIKAEQNNEPHANPVPIYNKNKISLKNVCVIISKSFINSYITKQLI